MYRCTIVQIHPPLNALGSKGSEEHYTRLCTRDNVHTNLTSGSPVFPFMVNTVRACGFHRIFADLRREGTTINSISYEVKMPNGRIAVGRSSFHMHPQIVKLEMGLLRRHTFPRGIISDASVSGRVHFG